MADLAHAMRLAAEHGMILVQCPSDPSLANIRCAECGWPGRAHDARIAVYAREPHGCHPCTWEREHGLECPGFPPRAERPAFYGVPACQHRRGGESRRRA